MKLLRLLSPIVVATACSPAAMMTLGGGTQVATVPGGGAPAMAASGPSHPPTTDAQWSTAEAAAADAARRAGAERVDPAIRVNETGVFAAKHLSVEGGRCYKVGIAWAFDAALNSSVSFGAGTNLSLQGFSHRIEAPGGILAFCADGSGAVDLTFSAVPPPGRPLGSDLLEYAVVVGSVKENATARASRRKQEAAQAKNAREASEATEARIAADDAAADKKRQEACAACKARFQGCTSASCSVAFSKCTFEEANDTTGFCTR